MSDKPVYRYKLFHDSVGWIFSTEQPKNADVYAEIEALYPAAAYEALQKENERLDFKFKHYWGRIRKVLQRHRERDAAQAKRIAELYDVANDHRYSYIAASKALDSQKSEIESLQKQVEELSQPIPDWKIELLFNRAIDYRELRISESAYDKAVREILSASKNGE